MTVTLIKPNRKPPSVQKEQQWNCSTEGAPLGRRATRLGATLKRKTQATQLATGLPIIQIEFMFGNKSEEVKAVRYLGVCEHPYSVCPTCGYAMDRDYQKHCEECGQALAWNKFNKGEVTIQRRHRANKSI